MAIDGQPLDISNNQAIRILQSARGLVQLIVARGPYPESENLSPDLTSATPDLSDPTTDVYTEPVPADMVVCSNKADFIPNRKCSMEFHWHIPLVDIWHTKAIPFIHVFQ